jgi:hypothetical protein
MTKWQINTLNGKLIHSMADLLESVGWPINAIFVPMQCHPKNRYSITSDLGNGLGSAGSSFISYYKLHRYFHRI